VTPAGGFARAVAKLLDLLFAGFVFFVVYRLTHSEFVSLAAMFLWFTIADAVAAPGKAFMGLRVVDAKTGKRCSIGQSLLRNSIFLPGLVRAELGWSDAYYRSGLTKGFLYLSAAALALETYWMFQRADRRRLGDALGDTRVVLR
jgi:uncharacterized RDD family membrane protein YckC